jgi:hypothetical protein
MFSPTRARLRLRCCCQRVRKLSAAVLLRLVVGCWGGCRRRPPLGDFTNNGCVRAAARLRPYTGCVSSWLAWPRIRLARSVTVGTASPDIGPTRDDHGALAESREPGKRPWIRGCWAWEAPVQHGAMSAAVLYFAAGGRCLQVAEGVLTGLRRQVEEVGPQGQPGRLVGEVGTTTWSARPSSA